MVTACVEAVTIVLNRVEKHASNQHRYPVPRLPRTDHWRWGVYRYTSAGIFGGRGWPTNAGYANSGYTIQVLKLRDRVKSLLSTFITDRFGEPNVPPKLRQLGDFIT